MVIYQAFGELMEGFLGNILYETVLPKGIEQLEITVSFGKREKEAVTETDREACRAAWVRNCKEEPSEEVVDALIRGQKTEINVSVYHNEVLLGFAHRDETEKKIVISPDGSSEGFRSWKPCGGVLRVVLHVYQMLNDHTPYAVTVTDGGRDESTISKG
ncbi:MAG: DUF6669 family protein [Fusicatenibacter sp.]|nr:hypothetical protein [Lachnospiraceae bacterium]MDY2939308.1 DUF6669 family protein [Fusicatenibacter sp.]